MQKRDLSCTQLHVFINAFSTDFEWKKLSTIGDISQTTKWLVSKRYIQAAIIVTLMTLAIAVPLFTRAFALSDVGNAGVFELDGNIVKDATTALPTDWGNGPGGTGPFYSTGTPNH